MADKKSVSKFELPPSTKAKNFPAVKEGDFPADNLAEILAADGDPMATLKAAAKATGLSQNVFEGLVTRLRAQYQPVVRELENIHTGQLLRQLETKANMALEYLDDYALAQSSAKDLAIIVGILLEKRQLLRGEPTQIISMEERQGLDELTQQLVKDARRRGLTIDMTAEDVKVLEPSQERATRPRSGAGDGIKWKNKKAQLKAKDEIGEPR